jgi:hypothetical protein
VRRRLEHVNGGRERIDYMMMVSAREESMRFDLLYACFFFVCCSDFA